MKAFTYTTLYFNNIRHIINDYIFNTNINILILIFQQYLIYLIILPENGPRHGPKQVEAIK
jgi:hypothetical protein